MTSPPSSLPSLPSLPPEAAADAAACFVLLDDITAAADAAQSRLYTDFVREHLCTDPGQLDAVWARVEADQRHGLHAALVADYEWGAKLQAAGTARLAPHDASALRVLMFRQLRHMSADEVSHWLLQQEKLLSPVPRGLEAENGKNSTSDAPQAAGVADLQASLTRAEFDAGIERIQRYIAAGDTYQVNYTYRLYGQQYGHPVSLYRRLRARQRVAYAALIRLPSHDVTLTPGHATAANPQWILSCSPELFLQHHAGQLRARPMKGTAPRHSDPAQDRASAQWLAHDAKNRAENVMIVDLLRNDLSRVARVGSVQVPALFSVETYATVHQMTSTVVAELASGTTLPQVLRALYPCGSITGAPKIHTMDLIADLETTPRGFYTGAIGWVDAPVAGQHCGNFCLNVAIRTLTLGAAQQGLRPASLGIGGGIVMDSTTGAEYDESRLKARFLTEMDPGFTLFETLRWAHGRLHNLPLHLRRLQASAAQLGFHCRLGEVQAQLAHYTRALAPNAAYRVRLDLCHDGSVRLQHAVLQALPRGPVQLLMSTSPVPAHESALLRFKTSLRSGYDQAIQRAQAQAAFDMIFVNAQGFVTEGARSNLLVQLGGRWYTPPCSAGVLPGVMRTRLLQRGSLTERALSLADLHNAQSLAICSALRGVRRAVCSVQRSTSAP